MANALFLDEACVRQLVTMEDALVAVEEVFGEQGRGQAMNVPRVRAPVKGGTLRITAAVLSYRGYYGVKVSSTAVFHTNAGRMFCLYREESGELCAVVQVFAMGALRTGAASGIATQYLANTDAAVLGVLGSGRQARTQVDAVCAVRAIREIRVWSKTPANREAFCDDLKKYYKIKILSSDTAEQAVRGSDVLVTATTATTPIVQGAWLQRGVHINAIGANYEHRRELDSAAVAAASFIATDDTEQVRYESTDIAAPVAEGVLGWDQVHSLGDVVAGKLKGRSAREDITLFKSLGVAIEDVALAVRAYEKALKLGIGMPLPDLTR
jgi:ornithine cyclodeaminase/alanine dehydrogenase-like protein (mu-crystallin family)